MAKKASDIHEAFARNLAFQNEILWDAYTPHQFPLFKQKLNELYRDVGDNNSERNKAMEKVRDVIYKSTIAQSKYTNRNLLSAFILVTVTEGTTYVEARDATKFSVHLVVRTRKCMKNNDSSNCCMNFIDEHGRVYKNWKAFIGENLLPKGIAFAPTKGTYTYEGEKLSMDSWETPANRLSRKVLATTDVAAGVSGFAAVGVTLAASAMPISAPLVATAAAVGAGIGVYSAIRSGWQLKTRRDHEQSIALTDRAARGCWIGVTSGVLATSSSVANRTLAQVALAGREVSLVHEAVVNGMNMSTMLLSGTGVANGIVDMLLKMSDDESITGSDWMQMASSLVIFTHSVHNFRLASAIVAKSRGSSANAYRRELSNTLAEMFDKMTQRRIQSSNEKVDIIRLTNEVPDFPFLNQINDVISSARDSPIEFVYNFIQGVLPLVLNEECLKDCVLFLTKSFGQSVTMYLVEKARQWLNRFRSDIESFLRTTIYYETVLWDLYQMCEQQMLSITLENLERNISNIFQLLFDYYQKMSCENIAEKIFECKICNGHFQITSIE